MLVKFLSYAIVKKTWCGVINCTCLLLCILFCIIGYLNKLYNYNPTQNGDWATSNCTVGESNLLLSTDTDFWVLTSMHPNNHKTKQYNTPEKSQCSLQKK